ncbi:MAG: PH domain-containing protein [Ruminococcus sp.]|nr:PH domain-containing protein [Ruminococcus sp.]
MKRQHPAALIGYTSKNFWLLLIPLIRALAALKFDLYRWAEGAGWDILAVTAMFAIACARWYFTLYEIADDSVRVRTGVFARCDIEIPHKCISAVTSEENPVYGRFGAVRLYIDTDAASGVKRSSADVKLIAYKKDRARLINLLSEEFSKSGGRDTAAYTYKVSKGSLTAFSLLFSSALSGSALIVTAFSGGSEIIGEQLERDFLGIVNDLSGAVAELLGTIIKGIPPTGIAISIIIAAGFFVSFINNILRYINFTVTRRNRCIIISGGLIVKRIYCINSDKINIADMRQNLLMKLFGITSVHVNCTGYGKRKNEFPVFVPVCSLSRLDGGGGKRGMGVMNMLLPGFSRSETFINPDYKYIGRFIFFPALLVIGIIFLELLMTMLYPRWHDLITFMTVLFEIPAVWLLIVKAAAYCTNGLNITEDSICAKYCSWYDFHTIAVPLERVAEIRITQTVFQRWGKSCDVIIYTNSEYIGGHRIKAMPITEVQEVIRERFR